MGLTAPTSFSLTASAGKTSKGRYQRSRRALASLVLYSSPRRFEVSRWGVGHAGLLLRSNPRDVARRVEVLFKPASAACGPASLDGIAIVEADDAARRMWASQPHGLDVADYATCSWCRPALFGGGLSAAACPVGRTTATMTPQRHSTGRAPVPR